VAVVGGGAVGCAVAFVLARAGLAVALFERGELAGESSGAAAGMLAPLGEAETDGPLRRWGLRALDAFGGLVEELRERTGIDPELTRSGLLHVATDEARAAALRRRATVEPGLGLAWLGAAELRTLEPALTPAACGALLSPREAHVRSPLLVRAFAEAAAHEGARLRTGTPVVGLARDQERVVGVETPEGRVDAGQVVLAAGSFTGLCARWLDPAPRLPVTPVRGQIVALDAPRPGPRATLWGAGGTYLVPKRDGSLVVGATTEHVGFDRRVTAGAVAALLDAGAALVPGLADAGFRRAWAGLRPDTPDHLPLVGPVPGAPGLVVAAGHYRNGVLLSGITAQMVADGLLGKGFPEPAFLPARFGDVPCV
jgi:glycine oxidase